MKKLSICFLFLISVFLFSCNKTDDIPRNIIKPKEMKNILWDVMQAQTLAQETAFRDSALDVATETKVLSQKVFQIHKTDSAQFGRSYNWYIKHPILLKTIFDSLYAQKQRVNELRLKQREKAAGHPL